jgi:hypothetical protein
VVVVPPKVAPGLVEMCQTKEDREVFERMRIRETGDVSKYHPMNAEAYREYEAWLAARGDG